jgi:hypothetical protein
VILAADTLPEDGGYVAAAYLVFLFLLLIYFAISAVRLSRVEKTLVELNSEPARDE